MQKWNFELDFLWHRNLEQHESKSFGTAVNLEIESDISEHEVACIHKRKGKVGGSHFVFLLPTGTTTLPR